MDIFKTSGSERFTIFPIKYDHLWKFYKQHVATFWTAEEVKLTDDLSDWNNKLTDNERFFIKNVLAFFAASDGIVNENLVVNFYNEVQIPEARNFYTFQMAIESIHSEMYSILIDTYVLNSEEKFKLFNAIENIPAVEKKANWALKWIEQGPLSIPDEHMKTLKFLEKCDDLSPKILDSLHYLTKQRASLAQRLLAFVCVEGIFFSGSFCAIYWLKNRGLMPGLSTANQFISRDENLHSEFAISLYKLLPEKLDSAAAYAIFKEAVEIEIEFITQSLPVDLIGMNSKLMIQYIQYVADRWLQLLGYEKLYNSQNPFGFMELISVNEKTNFFENTVANYQRANVGSNAEDREISFDADF